MEVVPGEPLDRSLTHSVFAGRSLPSCSSSREASTGFARLRPAQKPRSNGTFCAPKQSCCPAGLAHKVH